MLVAISTGSLLNALRKQLDNPHRRLLLVSDRGCCLSELATVVGTALIPFDKRSEALEEEAAWWLEENREFLQNGEVAPFQRRRCRHLQRISIHTLFGERNTNTAPTGYPRS